MLQILNPLIEWIKTHNSYDCGLLVFKSHSAIMYIWTNPQICPKAQVSWRVRLKKSQEKKILSNPSV